MLFVTLKTTPHPKISRSNVTKNIGVGEGEGEEEGEREENTPFIGVEKFAKMASPERDEPKKTGLASSGVRKRHKRYFFCEVDIREINA